MKRLVGIILVGLMLLACGEVACARGHRSHHSHYSRRHHSSCNSSWNTFGEICAGVLVAGLIVAALSGGEETARPCCNNPPPPPPPPPVQARPVYYIPVYR